MFSERFFSSWRRNLRMVSGLVLFTYIGTHLLNHALGLISLDAAEAGMTIAVEVWYSLPGTILLYGAFVIHFMMALVAVYERRTFRLPPLELLRIVLGFTMPILLIGHAASTRLAYEMFGLSSDYNRVVSNLWATGSQGWQLGLMAPGWLHGCLGLHSAFSRRWWYRQFRFVLFSAALLLPVLAALGFIAMGKELAASPAAAAAALEYLNPSNAAQRLALAQWKDNLLNWYFSIIGAAFIAREIRNLIERRGRRLVSLSYPGQTVRVPRGWSVLEASRSFHLPHAAMCGGRARCSTCRVRVTNGEEFCPPAANDEQATLSRIGADARRAPGLPVAAAGRYLGRAAGSHRAPDLPGHGAATERRARGRRAVLRLPQSRRPVERPPAAGFAVCADACMSRASATPSALPAPVELCRVRQHLRAVSDMRATPMPRRGRCGRRGDRGGHRRPQQSAWPAPRQQSEDRRQHPRRAGGIDRGRIVGVAAMLMAEGEEVDGANDLRKAAADNDKAFAISVKSVCRCRLAPVPQGGVKTIGPARDNGLSLRCGADSVAALNAARRARPPRHAAAAMGGG